MSACWVFADRGRCNARRTGRSIRTSSGSSLLNEALLRNLAFELHLMSRRIGPLESAHPRAPTRSMRSFNPRIEPAPNGILKDRCEHELGSLSDSQVILVPREERRKLNGDCIELPTLILLRHLHADEATQRLFPKVQKVLDFRAHPRLHDRTPPSGFDARSAGPIVPRGRTEYCDLPRAGRV